MKRRPGKESLGTVLCGQSAQPGSDAAELETNDGTGGNSETGTARLRFG